MRASFTVPTLKNYKPSTKRREISDAGLPMLRLRIEPKPNGTRSWIMRFRRPGGKSGMLRLGSVQFGAETKDEPVIGGPLTLGQARELAQRIARERASGVDVVARERAKKTRKRTEHQDRAANTFGVLAVEFIRDYEIRKYGGRPRRWHEDARRLGMDWPRASDPAATEPEILRGSLADIWRDRPVAEIDRADIKTQLQAAHRSGTPGLARRNPAASRNRERKLFSVLSVFCRWLLRNDKITVNPMAGLERPEPPLARQHYLDDRDIRWFWKATEQPEPFAVAFRTLLLTGARLREVAGMRRDELNDNGDWIIPATRTKNRREFLLPLPALAREQVAALPVIENPSGLVFTTNGRTQISGWSKAKRELDAAIHKLARAEDAGAVVPHWRLHDLRRSAATGMNKLGIAPHIVESCLNHISGFKGGVAGTYNVYTYDAEKKAALARWAMHIAGLVADEPGKVTNISERRKARRS